MGATGSGTQCSHMAGPPVTLVVPDPSWPSRGNHQSCLRWKRELETTARGFPITRMQHSCAKQRVKRITQQPAGIMRRAARAMTGMHEARTAGTARGMTASSNAAHAMTALHCPCSTPFLTRSRPHSLQLTQLSQPQPCRPHSSSHAGLAAPAVLAGGGPGPQRL